MRLTLDVNGPRWMWTAILCLLAIGEVVACVFRARLYYWQHRLNATKRLAELLNDAGAGFPR